MCNMQIHKHRGVGLALRGRTCGRASLCLSPRVPLTARILVADGHGSFFGGRHGVRRVEGEVLIILHMRECRQADIQRHACAVALAQRMPHPCVDSNSTVSPAQKMHQTTKAFTQIPSLLLLLLRRGPQNLSLLPPPPPPCRLALVTRGPKQNTSKEQGPTCFAEGRTCKRGRPPPMGPCP